MVIWFIGLSGSGKTYMANSLYKKIKPEHPNTFLIDGDSFRDVMQNDLGYSLEDREKNGCRISRLSKWLNDEKINVIASVLSIFPAHQIYNKENNDNYYQIYMKNTVKKLSENNSKNIYDIDKNVVGKDIPFIEPINSNKIYLNDYKESTAETFIDEVYGDIKPLLY